MKRVFEIKRVKKELVETADGTFTARSEEFDECYHSTKDGALTESLKKHVEPAFSLIDAAKERLEILDICFGLGYNTLATLLYIRQKSLPLKIRITSPEMDEELVRSLVDFPYAKALCPFKAVIESIAKRGFYEDEQLFIEVKFGDARGFLRNTDRSFDVVYQDAFSPKKNPALWTKEYFINLTAHMQKRAVLTTYSCATPVRLAMAESGLHLYKPPQNGVRSGTIASPSSNLPLEPIDMELKKERNPSALPLTDKVAFAR